MTVSSVCLWKIYADQRVKEDGDNFFLQEAFVNLISYLDPDKSVHY